MTLAETIKQRVLSELQAHNYNMCRSARALGVSRRALYRLLERHHLVLPPAQRWQMPGEPKDKQRAHSIVTMAIKRGLKVLPCEVCKTTKGVQAHHEDYSKPLSINWLCAKHHAQLHADKRVVGGVNALQRDMPREPLNTEPQP